MAQCGRMPTVGILKALQSREGLVRVMRPRTRTWRRRRRRLQCSRAVGAFHAFRGQHGSLPLRSWSFRPGRDHCHFRKRAFAGRLNVAGIYGRRATGRSNRVGYRGRAGPTPSLCARRVLCKVVGQAVGRRGGRLDVGRNFRPRRAVVVFLCVCIRCQSSILVILLTGSRVC